jgi:hypothetical protein
MSSSLGTGEVYTPEGVRVIHFGSPVGSEYQEAQEAEE